MLYLIVHILVYGIAAILALRLTPGVEVGNTLGILEWPLIGLVFGLLNAFIRPVIVLFTGRLIIRTLGLFLIVINAILLWLLAWIFRWQVDTAIWLLWGGLVVGILMAVMDALFGLNRPLIKDNAENSRIWNVMIKLSGNRSNTLIANLRLQQVYDIIYSYGSAILLDRVPVVGTVRAWFGKWIYKDADSGIAGLSTAAQVRVMLQTLGPTFVKFGQMVSSRAEALPPEWQAELAKLQSNVPPFPSAEAIAIVEEELKHPISELFASFTRNPLPRHPLRRSTMRPSTPVSGW
ncbi:MAG: phage holin family protein [Anaerolineales bacterium]|nr:phage holin family protein [Anaerolineales bacterium]